MTLWYTLFTSVLLAIFLPLLYQAIHTSMFQREVNNLNTAMSQVEGGVTFHRGSVRVDESLNLPENISLVITDQRDNVVYANSRRPWLQNASLRENQITTIRNRGDSWVALRKTLSMPEGSVTISLALSLIEVQRTMRATLVIMLVTIPLYFLVTIFGGLFIARKALAPISKITDLAKEIGQGDLTKRIQSVESRDEVGQLAETFNDMLNSLEQSFEKEKRFTSDASHELRTPLAIIMANSESLLATSPNDEMVTSISAIYQESRRMNNMISKLLMLTRGVEGKYKLELEVLNVKVVVDAVIEELEEAAKEKGIFLVNGIDSLQIRGDQSLFTQLMLNLVGNGIKYGRKEGHVWIENTGQTLTVRDDGIGILPEDLPFVFDRFYRADKARDRSGSGLGLSIVKLIADVHGWQLKASSKAGEGTTFNVTFNDL